MRVLMTPMTGSATAATQGSPLDGELAVLAVTAAGVGDAGVFRERPRRFVGLDSHADACLVEVTELDVSPHVVMAHVQESAGSHGPRDEDRLVELSAQMTAEMLHVAQQFPIGTFLHRDGGVVHALVPLLDRPGRRSVCDPRGSA
jgi:hypothetical protein